MNLIPRLYDVTGGTVYFDGTDVRKLDLSTLRGSVGVVTQDTYLFNGTIRENLRYAKEEATEEEMIEASIPSDIQLVCTQNTHSVFKHDPVCFQSILNVTIFSIASIAY